MKICFIMGGGRTKVSIGGTQKYWDGGRQALMGGSPHPLHIRQPWMYNECNDLKHFTTKFFPLRGVGPDR